MTFVARRRDRPSQLVRVADTELLIESWSNAARTVELRGYTQYGTFEHDHTTNSDRSRAESTLALPDIPLMVQASPSVPPVRRGECYVRITLRMGGMPVGRLSAGYLTDSKTMTYPAGVFEGFTEGAGYVHLVEGTNPLAGEQVIELVPENCRWRLISMMVRLVTDATVADRVVGLLLDNGVQVFARQDAKTAQTASMTVYYYWGEGLLVEETGMQWTEPLPVGIILPENYRLRVFATNFQTGDDYGPPAFLVEEWIEE